MQEYYFFCFFIYIRYYYIRIFYTNNKWIFYTINFQYWYFFHFFILFNTNILYRSYFFY